MVLVQIFKVGGLRWLHKKSLPAKITGRLQYQVTFKLLLLTVHAGQELGIVFSAT